MRNKTIYRIVLTALLIAMVAVATLIIRIPTPTEGYINLGDAMVFISVFVLGKREGSIAAGFGSALADIIGGYPVWAPWTLVIKFLMAFVLGLLLEMISNREETKNRVFSIPVTVVLSLVTSGFVMVSGYYIASAVMVGNLLAPLVGIIPNIIQFVTGMIICLLVLKTLFATSSKSIFTHTF